MSKMFRGRLRTELTFNVLLSDFLSHVTLWIVVLTIGTFINAQAWLRRLSVPHNTISLADYNLPQPHSSHLQSHHVNSLNPDQTPQDPAPPQLDRKCPLSPPANRHRSRHLHQCPAPLAPPRGAGHLRRRRHSTMPQRRPSHDPNRLHNPQHALLLRAGGQ